MEELENKTAKPRERNNAHGWWDKRIPRFFRKNFSNITSKNLRTVYFALCEIDSDFTEQRHSNKPYPSITEMCYKYSRMSKNLIIEYLKLLKELGFIDYGRHWNKNHKVDGSFLIMYEWLGEETYKERIKDIDKSYIIENNNIEVNINIKNNKLTLKNKNNKLFLTKISSSKEEDKEPKAPSSSSPDKESFNNEFVKVTKRRTFTKPNRQLISEALLKQSQQSKKENRPSPISDDCKEIIDYWLKKGFKLTKDIKFNRITSNNTILLINKVLKKYSVDDIKYSIDQFYLASTDTGYEPKNKTKYQEIKLDSFIQSYNGIDKTYYSYLDQFFRYDLIPAIREDKFPILTNAIKSRYRKEVIGNANVKFTNKDEDQFRLAAIKVQEFWERNINVIRTCFNYGPRDKARLLIEAIKENLNGKSSMITPGWLCTDFTFNQRLPAYLNSQGVMEMTGETTGTDMNAYNKEVERQSRLKREQQEEEIDYYVSADITF